MSQQITIAKVENGYVVQVLPCQPEWRLAGAGTFICKTLDEVFATVERLFETMGQRT